LDLTGTIGANLSLVIDSEAPNTLQIDSDSTVGAVTINSANQTLQVGADRNVTISAAQTVTSGTLRVEAGITLAGGGILSGGGTGPATTAIKGSGTLSLGLSTANTVTASGGTLDITGAIATGTNAPTLAIATAAGSVLKIDTDATIKPLTITNA